MTSKIHGRNSFHDWQLSPNTCPDAKLSGVGETAKSADSVASPRTPPSVNHAGAGTIAPPKNVPVVAISFDRGPGAQSLIPKT